VSVFASQTGRDIRSLVGDSAFLRSLSRRLYPMQQFGIPTITDILKEWTNPGLTHVREFKARLPGRRRRGHSRPQAWLCSWRASVSNVAKLLVAFVDYRVHSRTNLVGISPCSGETFVKDPRDVVKAGDIVRVKVMAGEIPRPAHQPDHCACPMRPARR